jgi:hypothetical protein
MSKSVDIPRGIVPAMVRLPTPRLAAEFERLRRTNFPLALLVDALARFVRDAFARDVTVTSIHRARPLGRGAKKVGASFEVLALPGLDRAALRAAGPHAAWQAVDVASAPFPPAEVEAILAFGRRFDALNRLPPVLAAGSRTIWLHEWGTREPHLHLQYRGPPVHAV